MKIEAGKYYKTRDGRKVGPMRELDRETTDWPWTDKLEDMPEQRYTDDGKEIGTGSDCDLVSEWLPWETIDYKSPIRTVTRREIVPGTYGNVYVKGEISGHPLGRVCLVGVSTTTDAVGLTAEELREAAHILNQIAEVLQENGE